MAIPLGLAHASLPTAALTLVGSGPCGPPGLGAGSGVGCTISRSVVWGCCYGCFSRASALEPGDISKNVSISKGRFRSPSCRRWAAVAGDSGLCGHCPPSPASSPAPEAHAQIWRITNEQSWTHEVPPNSLKRVVIQIHKS